MAGQPGACPCEQLFGALLSCNTNASVSATLGVSDTVVIDLGYLIQRLGFRTRRSMVFVWAVLLCLA